MEQQQEPFIGNQNLFSLDGETMSIETLGEAFKAGWRVNVESKK